MLKYGTILSYHRLGLGSVSFFKPNTETRSMNDVHNSNMPILASV